jgi:hypothetical protein
MRCGVGMKWPSALGRSARSAAVPSGCRKFHAGLPSGNPIEGLDPKPAEGPKDLIRQGPMVASVRPMQAYVGAVGDVRYMTVGARRPRRSA